jgi:hypothetical protein
VFFWRTTGNTGLTEIVLGRFQVLTAASMKATLFCNVALCSLVKID